jgi:hypothetical protein
MFKILDGRTHFFQWDFNQKLIVEDNTINEVHYCNRTDDCSLVVEVKEENGLRVADVPNILLQDYWKIRVYAFCTNHTKVEETFDVVKRSKPADYVYTQTELKNYEDIKAFTNKKYIIETNKRLFDNAAATTPNLSVSTDNDVLILSISIPVASISGNGNIVLKQLNMPYNVDLFNTGLAPFKITNAHKFNVSVKNPYIGSGEYDLDYIGNELLGSYSEGYKITHRETINRAAEHTYISSYTELKVKCATTAIAQSLRDELNIIWTKNTTHCIYEYTQSEEINEVYSL